MKSYEEWKFCNSVFTVINGPEFNLSTKHKHAYSNAIERWFLTLHCVENFTFGSEVFEYDADETKKLHNELKDKGFSNETITKIFNKINTSFIYALQADALCEQTPVSDNDRLMITKKEVQYKTFKRIIPARLNRWRANPEQLAEMLMKYASISLNGRQQWSLAASTYNALYKFGLKDYDIVVEGFASPLNSKLMGMNRAAYCSLFECDKEFGSKGRFEDVANVRMRQRVLWILNPPMVLQIINQAISIVLRRNLSAIIFLPNWNDFQPIEYIASIANFTIDLPFKKYRIDHGYGTFDAKLHFLNVDASQEELAFIRRSFA